MFSTSGVLKEVYKENRGLINALGVIILGLIIALLVTTKHDQPAVSEDIHTKINETVKAASVDNANLDKYLPELHKTIAEVYGEILNGYEIDSGELLEDDSWYVTTIFKPIDQWSLPEDTFRIVLHRNDDDSWKIVAGPEIIFSYLEYPDIPKPVLYNANNL